MFAKIRSLFRGHAPQGEARAASCPPALETLEDRTAPATLGAGGLGLAGNVSAVDVAYLQFAAQGDEQEIFLGTIAQYNSTNAAVQAFGQKLVADHAAALQQELPLLQQAGLSLPSLRPDQLDEIQRFQGLNGMLFDAPFALFMIVDHVQDLFVGSLEQDFGANADVKAYAASQTPVLQAHLSIALSLENPPSSSPSSGYGPYGGIIFHPGRVG